MKLYLRTLAPLLFLFSLPSSAEALSSEEISKALTCTSQSAGEMERIINKMGEGEHFREQDGTARAESRYTHNGICVTQVVFTAAMGYLVVISKVCTTDLSKLQKSIEQHFGEMATSEEMLSEGAFFMRKRGNDFAAFSRKTSDMNEITLTCAVRFR